MFCYPEGFPPTQILQFTNVHFISSEQLRSSTKSMKIWSSLKEHCSIISTTSFDHQKMILPQYTPNLSQKDIKVERKTAATAFLLNVKLQQFCSQPLSNIDPHNTSPKNMVLTKTISLVWSEKVCQVAVKWYYDLSFAADVSALPAAFPQTSKDKAGYHIPEIKVTDGIKDWSKIGRNQSGIRSKLDVLIRD